MHPLPLVNQAYSMVTQEEDQRGITHSSPGQMIPLEPTTMTMQGGRQGRGGRGRRCSQDECTYCKRKGHKRENCYHLIGFLVDYRGHNKPENQINQIEGDHSATSLLPPLTQAQYDGILQLLKKENHDVAVGTVDHIEECVSGLLNNISPSIYDSNWILDSGATCHVVGSLTMLDFAKPYVGPLRKIKMPSGNKIIVTHTGSVKLFADILLDDVYCAPQCCFNLIFVFELTKSARYIVSFYLEFCSLQEISTGSSQKISKINNGLYLIGKDISLNSLMSVKSTSSNNEQKSMLWHDRLGHAPLEVLRHLDFLRQEIRHINQNKCEACIRAKQIRLPFSSSTSKIACCFELVHIDVWGPYNKYAMVIDISLL